MEVGGEGFKNLQSGAPPYYSVPKSGHDLLVFLLGLYFCKNAEIGGLLLVRGSTFNRQRGTQAFQNYSN